MDTDKIFNESIHPQSTENADAAHFIVLNDPKAGIFKIVPQNRKTTDFYDQITPDKKEWKRLKDSIEELEEYKESTVRLQDVLYLIENHDNGNYLLTEIKNGNKPYSVKKQENNKNLTISFEAASDGLWFLDFSNNDVLYSDGYYKMLGYEAGEFEATFDSWANLIHPEDKKKALKTADSWLNQRSEHYENTFRLKQKDGTYKWIRSIGIVAERNNEGKIIQIIGRHEDISKQKEIDIIKESQNKQYIELFDNQPIALWQEDFSEVWKFTEGAKRSGKKLNYETLQEDEKLLNELASKVKIIRCNKEAYQQIDRNSKNENLANLLKPEVLTVFAGQVMTIYEGKTQTRFEYSCTTNETNRSYILNWRAEPGFEKDYSRVIVSVTEVTELKDAKKALKISKERLKVAFEGTLDGLWDWDLNSNKAFHSEQFARMLGFEPDELPYTSEAWSQLLHPDDIKYAYQKVNDYLSGKNSKYESVFRMKTKDGHYKWIKGRGKFVRGTDGQPERFIGFNTDITAQKNAEDRLERSEHLLKNTLNSINEVVIFLDSDYTIKLANHAAARILNIPLYQFEGRKCYELLYGRDSICPDCPAEKTLKTKTIQTALRHRPDGTVLDRKVYPAIIDRKLTGAVIVSRDISKQVQDEREILQSRNLAKENEAKWELLYHNMPNASLQVNNQYIIEDVNEVTCRITGYSREELIGQRCDIICPKGPHKCPVFDLGKSKIDNNETKVKTKDGTFVPVLKSCRRFQHEGTDIIIENFQDISHIKKIEHELVKARDKAEESDRLKSAFLANMSHEIRTPMNGIMGFAELLRQPNLSTDEQDVYLDVIRKSGKRMLNIISDLIDISRIESGSTELFEEETHTGQMLFDLFTFFEPEAKNKGIKLINNWPKEGCTIITDKTKLNQILSNLIKNAIKYTHQGKIEIGCKKVDCLLSFYVKDTGIGIPKELHAKVFERFRQAEISVARQYEGAGLGLSICQAYAKLLGGEIKLESEAGNGSCFYLELPCKPILQTDSIKYSEQSIKTSKKLINVLIAEDDEDNYFLLHEFLSKNNVRCIHALDGIEAFEMVRSNSDVQLVLMDIKMPRMDGFEATRRIRDIKPNLPVIAQTAFASEDDKVLALESGCSDYISKPIRLAELYDMILKYHI